jgi:uncharacterized protein YggU (UPF0235/DUF167 family)
VEPDADEFRVENSSIPIIHLEAEPENGRANAELVSKLTDILGTKPGIVSGHKSRRKKIRVDMDQEELENKMEAHMNG